MESRLLHIFRNTPLGRETLLQSVYFCKNLDASLTVYIPVYTKFLMYFENDVVQIDLDASYLSFPHTAKKHVRELIDPSSLRNRFLEPKHFTASTLPDIPVNFDFMTCPRSMSDPMTKIGLGHIGNMVRRIVKSARFPVLITTSVFKPWNRITVLFGGSPNSINALKLALRLSRISGKPLDIFTQAENMDKAGYEELLAKESDQEELSGLVENRMIFETGSLEENLYDVAHDSLVVLGAFGHGLIKDILFGSRMEAIHSILPNPLLIVGPNYRAGLF